MKEKINLEYRYYKKIEENQEKIKRIYHDINNHMICISNLSNEKDVKEYVKSLDLNIGYINFNFGNKILDIIISEKYQLCKDKGIRFDIVADFSKLDFIDMMDLCVIFSNALDNAIEACDKILDDSKDKYISVNVTYINSFCFIKIENSKINEINIKNNNFITNIFCIINKSCEVRGCAYYEHNNTGLYCQHNRSAFLHIDRSYCIIDIFKCTENYSSAGKDRGL